MTRIESVKTLQAHLQTEEMKAAIAKRVAELTAAAEKEAIEYADEAEEIMEELAEAVNVFERVIKLDLVDADENKFRLMNQLEEISNLIGTTMPAPHQYNANEEIAVKLTALSRNKKLWK